MANEVAKTELEIKHEPNIATATKTLTDADLIIVDSIDMYEIADEMRNNAHSFIKRVEAEFAESLSAAKKAYDAVRNLKNKIIEPAELAKETLGRKLGEWQTKERIRIRQAEEEAERARQAEIAAAQRALVDTESRAATGEATWQDVEHAEADVAVAEVGTAALVPRARSAGGSTDGVEIEFHDLPAWLEFLAKDLRTDAPRFAGTLSDFKVTPLKDFYKATKGTKTLPGVTFKPKTTVRARG